MSLEGKSYGSMPYEERFLIFKRIRLQFMRMLLRLKSTPITSQKLCGCKGKVKRLLRKRW